MKNPTLRTVKIKDLGRVVTGSTPPTRIKEYFGSEYPFIKPSDIGNDSRYIRETEMGISEEGKKYQENRLLPRDTTCVVCIGTIGKLCLTDQPSFTNQQISSIIVDQERYDPVYIYYLLRTAIPKVKKFEGGSASGRHHVKKSSFELVEIDVHDLHIQRRIASILSSYDSLIENNRRRIQLLEEMARALYREWFVHFRFPGHEEEMVDSELGEIPRRWIVTTLDEILSKLESGKRPKGGIDSTVTDVPSVGAENILGLGQYNYLKEKYVTHEFFNKMKRGHIESGDVLLYKDGASLGRKSIFRDGFPHKICCINEHVFLLRTNPCCTQNYLYFWLDLPDVTQAIINLNSNAAQPGINQKGVRSLKILLPDTNILNHFESHIDSLMGLLFNLAKTNQILNLTRNLLLPKLVSGRIDVSDMKIEILTDTHKTAKYSDQSPLDQWLDGDDQHGPS